MCENMPNRLHSWMYTLLYPAVLGFMIVTVILEVTHNPDNAFNLEFAYALFLMAYFCSQHVENIVDSKNYGIIGFLADVVEIVCMFLLFMFLGMVKTKFSFGAASGVTWGYFYFVLVIVFVLPVFARSLKNRCNPFPGNTEDVLSMFSLLAMSFALTGIISGEESNILIFLTIILSIYLVFFVFLREKTSLWLFHKKP